MEKGAYPLLFQNHGIKLKGEFLRVEADALLFRAERAGGIPLSEPFQRFERQPADNLFFPRDVE